MLPSTTRESIKKKSSTTKPLATSSSRSVATTSVAKTKTSTIPSSRSVATTTITKSSPLASVDKTKTTTTKTKTVSTVNNHQGNQPKLIKSSKSESFLYKKIASDNVILILDFLGGELEGDLSCIPLVIKNCFGKFQIDSTIKFLFRYGAFYSNQLTLPEMVFLHNEQYKQCKKSTLDRRILSTLCTCPLTHTQTDEEILLAQTMAKLEQFSKENKKLCSHVKELNFYRMPTFWQIVEKSLEIFPNFEKLLIGNDPNRPTKVPVKQTIRKYYINTETFPKALQKSNGRCKSLVCHRRNIIKGDVALQMGGQLEKLKIIATDYMKRMDHFEELKNLKSLNLQYLNDRSYGQQHMECLPQFFENLSKLNLFKFKLNECYINGNEFRCIKNSLPNLTYLNLNRCFLEDSQGESEIFEAIGTLYNLKTLVLFSNRQSDSIEKLVNLKKLEYLETSSSITFNDLKAICTLTNLKSLLINSNLYVSDEEGKVLTQLTKLEQLSFVSGGDEYFTTKLILFLFKNLNVQTYRIAYHGNDVAKLPQHVKDKMGGYCKHVK